jgi:Asp-tRNA(Asn)/Glu-tRNA(Gln) amidotransferase A subunit family amidase
MAFPETSLPLGTVPLLPGERDLLASIDDLERQFEVVEPDIRAFLPEPRRFERMRRQAQDLAIRFPDPEKRPAFFGLPVGVKDIFHVEGLPTRAGSSLPAEVLRGQEGWSIRRLQEAGALVAGKTVTTEFAYFSPGPTRNPRNLGHTPGGSSSGSAASVAAGLCPFSLGTQTIGSVIRPAAFCGVLGFKPTFGRIPPSGLIPLSPSLDHVGFFARDLALIETAAGVLVRGWSGIEFNRTPVLAVPVGEYLRRVSNEGLENFNKNLSLLEASGFEVERVSAMPDFGEIVGRHDLILAAEALSVHRAWYAEFGALYHDKTRELLERGKGVKLEELVLARTQRGALRRQLTDLMERFEIDAWIAPSAPGTAPEDLGSTGDPVMNLPWTQAGMPAINLPSGYSAEGLPFGIQLICRFGEDEQLLKIARQIEAAIDPSDSGLIE